MVTLDQAGAGAASVCAVPPSPALRARVQHFWIETRQSTGDRGLGAWRIVADHCGHLLYHRVRGPDGTLAHRLVLVGPRTVAVDIDKRRRLVNAGVRLQPWALPALFDVTAAELSDRGMALYDVLGRRASALADQLEAAAPEELPGVLERWLTPFALAAEFRDERRARYAARLLAGATACGDTASELGISSRRLRGLMHEQIGLAPKTFARIVRLHDALERARAAGGAASWSRIAAVSAFTDQAHLIREFKDLLRETPGTWVRRSSKL
ncbi:MAG: helix-turn-helix domain-containing protein [Gammaproteobacteria bacterium]